MDAPAYRTYPLCRGWHFRGVRAVPANPELARGANVWRGRIVYPAVAAAGGETPPPLSDLR